MVILHIHDTSLIFIYTHLVLFINPDEVRYVIPIHNSLHPGRHTVIHINNTNSHLPKPRPSREKKKKSPILQTPPPAYQNHTYQPKTPSFQQTTHKNSKRKELTTPPNPHFIPPPSPPFLFPFHLSFSPHFFPGFPLLQSSSSFRPRFQA